MPFPMTYLNADVGVAVNIPWHFLSKLGNATFPWHFGMRVWGLPWTSHDIDLSISEMQFPHYILACGFRDCRNRAWYWYFNVGNVMVLWHGCRRVWGLQESYEDVDTPVSELSLYHDRLPCIMGDCISIAWYWHFAIGFAIFVWQAGMRYLLFGGA